MLGAPLTAGAQVESRAGDAEPASDYTGALSDILKLTVDSEGLVDYARLRTDLDSAFRSVVKAIETYDPEKLDSREERLAFWINAYNVQMLQHIVARPNLVNVVEGSNDSLFFRTPYLTAGRAFSLDDIEHGMLRGVRDVPGSSRYGVDSLDVRIHAAVNCAAVSCPRLRQEAYLPSRVDVQLDTAMAEFASSPEYIRMEGDTLVLSSLIDWYGADFQPGGMPAGDLLIRWMTPDRHDRERLWARLSGRTIDELREDPGVRFEYDWTVNARSLY